MATVLVKYVSRETFFSYKGYLFPIQNKGGIYTPIMRRICEQLESMLSHHSRVFIYRFDLHLSMYTPDNEVLSNFMSRLNNWLKTTYSLKRVAYIWVREHNPPTKPQHYHAVILIDGRKVDKPIKIQKHIEIIWNLGHLSIPPHPYYNIRRGEHSGVQIAIKRISYLAKVYTKSSKNRQTNSYSTSRIKPSRRFRNVFFEH